MSYLSRARAQCSEKLLIEILIDMQCLVEIWCAAVTQEIRAKKYSFEFLHIEFSHFIQL